MMASLNSRRGFIAGAVCGSLCCRSAVASRVSPLTLTPMVTLGYRPQDEDERGLWQSCERLEQDLAASPLLLNNLQLTAYTSGVLRNLLGSQADNLRLYIVRDPTFNASMAPNGMTVVHTGLFVRMRDEAQLAAVLGHESGHYLRRHSVASWRNFKSKSGLMAFVAAGSNVAAGASAAAGSRSAGSWIDMARSINSALALSIFSFDRAQESEADAYGIRLMEQAGYPPEAASAIWRQLIEERRASAEARGKAYHDRSRSALSTHPPDDRRMLDLADSAREVEAHDIPGRRYDARRAPWLAAIAPVRRDLLAEQIGLNDPGASLYLLGSLAHDGWDGVLRYWQGEAFRLRAAGGDEALAAAAYGQAISYPDAPPEAWRAHGYALIKSGRTEEGRQALTRYLALAPEAADAAMVRFSLAQ